LREERERERQRVRERERERERERGRNFRISLNGHFLLERQRAIEVILHYDSLSPVELNANRVFP